MFDDWGENPPLYVLVKTLVEGLAGAGKPRTLASAAAKAGIDEATLAKLRAEAGKALPQIKGRDPGLPKAAPVFDLDVLRRRNAERIAKAVKKDSANG